MSERTQWLLTPAAIRERCGKLHQRNVEGKGKLRVHPEKWDELVEFTLKVIKDNYPSLKIPFHSRMGHFRPGNINRIDWLEEFEEGACAKERAKVLVDLIIPSVLLDAGAGDHWKYLEERTGLPFTRSEGLGVASFHMFLAGQFSSNNKLQTDGKGLLSLTKADLEKGFQVTPENPLLGVDGRMNLLHGLGESLGPLGRPGDLVEEFLKDGVVQADDVLATVLKRLGPIWPSRLTLDDTPLGDTWSHPALGEAGSFESLVPFHKLSQWLSYSILDAMETCGFEVLGVENLTGLPEYRNGGLFLDMGLLSAVDAGDLIRGVSAGDPFTIEWRASTVILLDELAAKIQKALGKTPKDFPLAKVLEGGSWWAGRRIAAKKRPGGVPPINIISDGTVF
tara:strand:- start:4240 stop:5421 length:1182 start_codon:yes stop_codon:yes gene_type:complete